jgi:hypothetical protein
MKRSHKSSILIIALLITITVLRETGVITLDYYNLTSDINTQANWSHNITGVGIPLSGLNYTPREEKYSEIPIVVMHQKDTLYYKKGKGEPAKINIETFGADFLWIPLYKPAHPDISVSFYYDASIVKIEGVPTYPEPYIKHYKGNISGQLTLKGDIAIKGICSHRKAREIIGRLVAEQFDDKVEKYFSNLDN